jgi:hypothetical protein
MRVGLKEYLTNKINTAKSYYLAIFIDPEVLKYINIINTSTDNSTLASIELRTDSDIAPLMHALANNTVAASKITKINISNNYLKSINIPTNLTALEELSLDYNQLTTMKINDTLSTLKKLILSYNQLTTIKIPETLTALQILFISKNQLTTIKIPNSLSVLKNLELSCN